MNYFKTFAWCAVGLLVLLSAAPVLAASRPMIVVFNPQPGYSGGVHAADVLHRAGFLNTTRQYHLLPAVAASVDDALLDKLRATKGVAGVYPDRTVRIQLKESVPQIHVNDVHGYGVNGGKVRVCVIDTGIDHEHPFLQEVRYEYDFVESDNYAQDEHGHGTHVAGILSSTHLTYRGVAPGAYLMIARVLDGDGDGPISGVISGIEWCVAQGAQVISMSLGDNEFYTDTCDDQPLAIAVNAAVSQGVTVIAASGNGGNSTALSSPACASGAIAVGAIDKAGRYLQFSNGGQRLSVVAPGGMITSTNLGGGFAQRSGTSMATPHVAGIAALLIEEDPTLAPSEVRALVEGNAIDLGPIGFDNKFGYGRVDGKATYDVMARKCASCTQPPQLSSAAPSLAQASKWLWAFSVVGAVVAAWL